MHWTGITLLTVAGILLTGCGPQPEPTGEILVRHHFVGLAALEARPDLVPVRNVLALPESRRLADDVVRKLTTHLPTWFGAPPLGSNDTIALQPLVRAVLDSESCLEVRTRDGKVASWALAAKLDPAQVARVGADLRRVFGAAAGDKPEAGFEVAIGGVPGGARFASAGGWTLLGSGRGTFDAFQEAIRAARVPVVGSTNGLLDVEADMATIARLLNWREKPPGPVDQWPRLTLALEPRNGRLRTLAKLDYPQSLSLPNDPWQIPTNVLRDPMVGFTAVQGAGTWVGRLGVFSDLGVKEWPKQMFLWSLAGDPWQQYFAAPIPAATNLMAQVSLTLPVRVVTNMLWNGTLFSLRITNQATRVELHGIPYFSPFMEAQRPASGEQLFGGLFPQATVGGRPPPAGLLAQVEGRTNLVLYDWETTGRRMLATNPPGTSGPRVLTNDFGRLIQFKHLAQFVRLMLSTNATLLPTTRTGELLIPGAQWIDQALPLLGDTITEVNRTGPAQLSLTRQSQIGFSSLELIYLLRWLENPGFPGWLDLPDPVPARRRSGPPAPGAPAAPPAAVVPAVSPKPPVPSPNNAPRPTGAVPLPAPTPTPTKP